MTTPTEVLSLNSIFAGCRTMPVVAIFAGRYRKISSAERAEQRREPENAFCAQRCSELPENWELNNMYIAVVRGLCNMHSAGVLALHMQNATRRKQLGCDRQCQAAYR